MDENKVKQLQLKQVEVIIKAIQNLGGVASYSQIYDEYEKITGALMTVGRKAGIRKTIEQNSSDSAVFTGKNIFYTLQKGSGTWGLTDEYKNYLFEKNPPTSERVGTEKKTEEVVKPKPISKMNLPKRAKTPEEKLYKKIYRSFDKVKYIGDIPVNEEEYAILIDYLKVKLSGTMSSVFTKQDDPVFATALVQIGIHEYNGRYWPHASRLSGVKLDGNKQAKIGLKFYNTLVCHNKLHVEQNEIVNNILMHCFVTKYYAADFFEFLFAYYQYDLDRNLEVHQEMRDYLLACMKKAEDSPRAFRIKKGTADAATANEKGCKIRVFNILKWMDAYLFEDKLPENSPNRTAQFFVEWAKTSKRFTKEKNGYYSRGEKRFRYPYLHFDIKNEEFKIVLPVQTIPLSDDEENAELQWQVAYNDTVETINSETENTVIGCRNIDVEHVDIAPEDVFYNFKIELVKNGAEVIKRFAIQSDTARFFDTDYDYIVGNRLPEGDVFAFTKRNEELISDGFVNSEHYLGLDFYSLQLVKGNIVKKPDGKALSTGKEIQEGLLEHNLVEKAFIHIDSEKQPIYSKAPSVLVKMKNSSQSGTLISINGVKNRLDVEKCIVFKQDNSEYSYYLIDLGEYCKEDNGYIVDVDIPSDRKTRTYQFAIINDFGFEFIDAPYIFKTNGTISFNKNLSVTFKNNKSNRFDFNIDSQTDNFTFNVNGFGVSIDVPVFKWKFIVDDEWHIEKPEEIWHKEFPNYMYFVLPSNGGCIFSDQQVIDEEEMPKISFSYDSDNDYYVCDTRKILSWLELGKAIHNLNIQFDANHFSFLTVVTSCILVSSNLNNDLDDKQLVLRSVILGYSDCVVDVYCNGEIIADKHPLTSNGAKLSTDKLFGEYEVVFLEYDDDEDDSFGEFGEAVYSEFARKKYSIKNDNLLVGKKIEVLYITEDKKTQSIFSSSKYEIKDKISIIVERQDEEDDCIYYGLTNCSNPTLSKLNVQIEQIDIKNPSKVLLFFYDEEEECYVDFIYDKHLKTLLTQEEESLSAVETRNRYLAFLPTNYYFVSISK